MDVLTALSNNSDYSRNQLQLIVGAWIMSGLTEKQGKISLTDGDVAEEDYDKASLYSLLYALYRSLGHTLLTRFPGWRVGLITSDDNLANATGLPFSLAAEPVLHGGLRIKLYRTAALS